VAALPGNVQRVPADLAGGLSPHPEEDLVFHGGKTIRNLTFTNFYIGGDAAWQGDDRKNIDRALSAAMADPHLNNVIRQYFDNQQIAATFKPSAVLPGSKPAKFSQGDVEALVRRLRTSGALNAFALDSTVFNFILPRGTILTTDEKISGARLKINAAAANPVHPENEENSLQGLGGYHGSVHFPSLHVTAYYAISVFSEGNNGIAAFDKPWKNVVATLYHELQEARTDPDVEDAIKAGDTPRGAKFLGWVAKSGNEIGDFPMSEAGNNLGLVMKEVPLTDGSGVVPIQLQYSNFAHGPEGPIPSPHPHPASRTFVETPSAQAQTSARKPKPRVSAGA
jgi:hypothetical protein